MPFNAQQNQQQNFFKTYCFILIKWNIKKTEGTHEEWQKQMIIVIPKAILPCIIQASHVVIKLSWVK